MSYSFEDLEVWKRACSLAVHIYHLLKSSTDFGLRDQMQRSAVSIASNIAEGSERSGKEFARYLTIAPGSAAELRTQTYIAGKIGQICLEEMTEIVKETKEISRMLTGLAKSIIKRQRSRNNEFKNEQGKLSPEH
jgi:four helix bundle protein